MIRADLAAVGVTLVEMESPAAGCGILCFSRIDNELFSLLASLRRETRGSIIALAAPSIVLDPSVTWRLLAAGSSEVLICDGREDVAFQIQACAWNAGRTRSMNWRNTLPLRFSCWSKPGLEYSDKADCGCWTFYKCANITDRGEWNRQGAAGASCALCDARRRGHVSGRSTHPSPRRPSSWYLIGSNVTPELSGSEYLDIERGARSTQRRSVPVSGAFCNGERQDAIPRRNWGIAPCASDAEEQAIQEKKYKQYERKCLVLKRLSVCVCHELESGVTHCARSMDLADDLYHRISGWVFRTLPLRERREDILPMARFFPSLGFNSKALRITVIDPHSQRVYCCTVTIREMFANCAIWIERIAHCTHVGPGPMTACDIPEEDVW